jgi:hypothetical protein
MYGCAEKGMDDLFSIQGVFKKNYHLSIPGGISQTNHHLLILNKHGSYFIIEAIDHHNLAWIW